MKTIPKMCRSATGRWRRELSLGRVTWLRHPGGALTRMRSRQPSDVGPHSTKSFRDTFRPHHLDLHMCKRPALSSGSDDARAHIIIARRQAPKFDHRRLGSASAFERNRARPIELVGIRDHFDRAVLSLSLI